MFRLLTLAPLLALLNLNDGGGGEGGGGSGGDGGDPNGGDPKGGEPAAGGKPDDKPKEPDPKAEEKTLTQAEVDAAIAKRLNAEKTKWEQEAKERADREKMDEAERLKAEKADADKKAADAVTDANARIIRSEAKVAAVTAGAKAAQAEYVVKLADLSDVTVDDDGNPDAKAIKKAVEKVLTDVPALKVDAKAAPSGGDLGGGGGEAKATTIADAVNAKYAAQT